MSSPWRTGLSPILLLALVWIHLLYQLYLYVVQLVIVLGRITTIKSKNSHSTQLDDLTRTPNHLAVILTPSSPSPLLLFLYPFLDRYAGKGSKFIKTEARWENIPSLKNQAFLDKIIQDVTTIIRLCARHGIPQLTIYTQEELPSDVVQAISNQFPIPVPNSLQIDEALAHKRCPIPPRQRDFVEMASPDGSGSGSSDDEFSKYEEDTLASSNVSLLDEDHTSEHDPAIPQVSLHLATSSLERLAQRLQHQKRKSLTEQTQVRDKIEIRLNFIHQKDGKLEVAKAASHIEKSLASRLLGHLSSKGTEAVSRQDQEPDSLGQKGPERTNGTNAVLQTHDAQTFRRELVQGVTVPFFDSKMLDQGSIEEPDFMIIYGGHKRVRTLHGFPPWPIRLTELYYDPNMNADRLYSERDFAAAMRYFANSEQRYGR